MKRLGDLVQGLSTSVDSEHRRIQGAENLASKVLFPAVSTRNGEYVQVGPRVPPPKAGPLPTDTPPLGEYEAMLLSKLLGTAGPVLCLVGPMGAGKTTTLNYLVEILSRVDCDKCDLRKECVCERLLAKVDFRKLAHETYGRPAGDPEAATLVAGRLAQEICSELRARCRVVIADKQEFWGFWNDLVEKYRAHSDPEVAPVARRIIGDMADLYDTARQSEPTQAELRRREGLLRSLKSEAPEWYLKYLVLLWRYAIQTAYGDRQECALVVLDNLDSLAPYLQRRVLDFVMSSAHKEGPTFVVAVRPETRRRQGLADTIVDVVCHSGPRPSDVVASRIAAFVKDPAGFYDPNLLLTEDQFLLLSAFLCRTFPSGRAEDTPFWSFLDRASGDNIRLALLLAQGAFLATIADMKNPELTQHFLVRSCIHQGDQQFKGGEKAPVENIFDIRKVTTESRILLKARILLHIESQGGAIALSELRSTFVQFGYDHREIKLALNALLRHECQLLRSDGHDVFREEWGDEQETLYISEIGRGYIEYLICDMDYVTEVMLDSRIEETHWPRRLAYRYASDRLKALRSFLKDLYTVDESEVKRFLDRFGADTYRALFGSRLITLDIIQPIYRSAGLIAYSVVDRFREQRGTYERVLDEYTSMVTEVENSSEQLLGVRVEPVERFSF